MFSGFSTAFVACEHSPSPSPSTYLATLLIQQTNPLQEKGAVSGWCCAGFRHFNKVGTGAETGIKQRMLCKAKCQILVLQRWFRQPQGALPVSVLGWVGGKCRNQGQILAFHLSGTAGSVAKHCWAWVLGEEMRSQVSLSLPPLRRGGHPRVRKALGCPLGSSSTVRLVSSLRTLQASLGSFGKKL